LINTIYIEKDVKNHHRTQKILEKFPKLHKIYISHYGEIFNKKKQNFRLQKENPSLVIAKKHNQFVLRTPQNSGIIKNNLNFYFSHMYNCIYDCKYCYLQGLFSSANYILFVNYEDFFIEIENVIKKNINKKITFFSGYDCDSLALESITNFISETIPLFRNYPNVTLEIRTKSSSIYPFSKITPSKNSIIAYSLMPKKVSKILDIKTPSLDSRLQTIFRLSKEGWKIGLRFDPLIFYKNWEKEYYQLFSKIKDNLSPESIHSITFGSMRFSKKVYKTIEKSHPNEILFSSNLIENNNKISYSENTSKLMFEFCNEQFSKFVGKEILFYENF
tara:strand:+ start:1288 stop:2283 length:996 start_codon:yes stop_codon:yes gene_type:complete